MSMPIPWWSSWHGTSIWIPKIRNKICFRRTSPMISTAICYPTIITRTTSRISVLNLRTSTRITASTSYFITYRSLHVRTLYTKKCKLRNKVIIFKYRFSSCKASICTSHGYMVSRSAHNAKLANRMMKPCWTWTRSYRGLMVNSNRLTAAVVIYWASSRPKMTR